MQTSMSNEVFEVRYKKPVINFSIHVEKTIYVCISNIMKNTKFFCLKTKIRCIINNNT